MTPAWLADLSANDLDALRADLIDSRSLFSRYLAGTRQPSIERAKAIHAWRLRHGYPSSLHMIRPDLWGPEDTGP